jgi:hypothetical protein
LPRKRTFPCLKSKSLSIHAAFIRAIVDWLTKKRKRRSLTQRCTADTLLSFSGTASKDGFVQAFFLRLRKRFADVAEAFTFIIPSAFFGKGSSALATKAERGPARRNRFLAGIYAFTFFRWAEDETPDMSANGGRMAHQKL